ncbi:MAG: nuclear transport factor 2 family protein [Kofleriaceae bacterium]
MHGGRQRTTIVSMVMMVACSSSPAPIEHEARQITLDQTVALVERWVAADARNLEPVVAETAILIDANPSTGAMVFGRKAILEDIAKRAKTNRCTLDLAIVKAGEAAVLRHCVASVPARKPPTERRITLHRLGELRIDRTGAITRWTSWFDGLRALQQTGVKLGADARPDVAAARTTIARARNDQTEAANDVAARAFIAALDRRDVPGAARHIADGYTHHDLASAVAVVFASAAQYERLLQSELAPCEGSAYRVFSTITAESWVAVRYGHSCRPLDAPRGGSYTTGMWLLRFAEGRIVEGWRVSNRFDEGLQLGQIDQRELRAQIAAAGL